MSQYRNMQNQGRSVFPKSPLPGREGEGRGIAERWRSGAADSGSEARADAGSRRLQRFVRRGMCDGRHATLWLLPLWGVFPATGEIDRHVSPDPLLRVLFMRHETCGRRASSAQQGQTSPKCSFAFGPLPG